MRLEQLNSAANLDLNSPVANLVVNSRRNNRSTYQQSNQQNYHHSQNSLKGAEEIFVPVLMAVVEEVTLTEVTPNHKFANFVIA